MIIKVKGVYFENYKKFMVNFINFSFLGFSLLLVRYKIYYYYGNNIHNKKLKIFILYYVNEQIYNLEHFDNL